MMRKIIFILVVCLVALSSCQWDGKSGNTADVDVRVARYDRLQYEYVTMNSFSALQKMNTDYPQVTKLLIEDVFWVLVLISIWEQIILYINASIMTINVAVWSLIVLFRIVLPFIC